MNGTTVLINLVFKVFCSPTCLRTKQSFHCLLIWVPYFLVSGVNGSLIGERHGGRTNMYNSVSAFMMFVTSYVDSKN